MNSEYPLSIKKLETDAKAPVRAHSDDAGADLFCLLGVELPMGVPVKIRTGIAMAVPSGHVGMICDRSSMGAKGIRVLGGIVDAGYRGEVQVILINLTNQPLSISKGDKVAQILIIPIRYSPIHETTNLDDTARSAGGFGSTGK